MLIAQITDTHIRPKGKLLHHMLPTARYLRRCVAQLNLLQPKPDAVVATGDLGDRGKAKEYRRLRKILANLTIPLYVIPGNHDERDAFREAFDDHAYLPARGPLHYVVDDYPVRLLGLDTVRKKHPGGELDDERLVWLDARLEEAPNRPTFIFMHHPPFETGIPPIDAHGFRGLERFTRIIADHPQVVRVVSGHIHRAMTVVFAGTVASTAPSTAHQLVIDRNAAGVYGLKLEPPGFVLHRWNGERIESAVRAVEAFGPIERTSWAVAS
ncbi:MAG: phosphodiesterase [Candidatus Eremiobacteraeota bacterium]|nr:phosphodiesterase [Candidatus Eremiobacteraeota bacterium]